MPHSENFICLSYSTINFLIPKSDVVNAFFCDKANFIRGVDGDSKVVVGSQMLPYIDVDLSAKLLNQTIVENDIKTCVVLNCPGIFKESDTFGIVTSSDCKVQKINLNEFAIFSEQYSNKLSKLGLVACKFNKNEPSKINYLINANQFMKKYQERLA